MLWEVRHEWNSGAQFAFNCYRHWAKLVIGAGNRTGRFLHNKEGVTQRDPLAMVAYGLGVLPLICYLHKAHPRVTQPWYSDGSGAGGTFANIQRHLDYLMVQGPPRGYFPEPTKSIVVVSHRNVPLAEAFF